MKKSEQEKNALLGELFEKYHNVVLYTILKVLGEEYRYLAEDCLGQTFLVACRKKDELLSREKPIVWLIAAGKNCAKHCKREAIREQKRMFHDEKIVRNVADENGESFLEDMVYEDWIRRGVLQRLIDELHPRTRQAFVAKYIDGKSNAEIAAEMKVTESTVRTFLANAKRIIEKRVRSGEF